MITFIWIYGSNYGNNIALAKYICEKSNQDYYIANDSNSFDNYHCQRSLILDDVDSSFYADKIIFSLLDIYDKSELKTTFFGKKITSDTVIVVSDHSPLTWWKCKFDKNAYKLLRRINGGLYYVRGSEKLVYVSLYD